MHKIERKLFTIIYSKQSAIVYLSLLIHFLDMTDTELIKKTTLITTTSEKKTSTCDNCHAPLSGAYCSQCGQQEESTLKYFWVVILHLLDDFFSFDSRAARTLRPLFLRPAFLTTEYFSGRRVHYVPPLRLYLFISIVFFITLKFNVNSENSAISNTDATLSKISLHLTHLEQQAQLSNQEALPEINLKIDTFKQFQTDLSTKDNPRLINITEALVELEFDQFESDEPLSQDDQQHYDELSEKVSKVRSGEDIKAGIKTLSLGNDKEDNLNFDFLSKGDNEKLNKYKTLLLEKAEKALQSDPKPLVQQTIDKLPQLMFILLPLFAVLLKTMFLFSKRLYMEHLTVALHSHSFIFFTILLLQLIGVIQEQLLEQNTSSYSALTLVTIGLVCWLPAYLFIMQKRIYKQGYFLTLVKFMIIGLAYMGLIGITGIIAFIWGLTNI